MDNLVLSNIFFRKTRTLVTIAGVALGVVLVVLTVGLAHGFLNEQGRRNSAVTAEIWFRPPGGFSLNVASTLSLSTSFAEQLRAIEGVREAVPVGNILSGGRVVDGIDYDAFTRVSEVRLVEGRPVKAGDEAIIDHIAQRNRNIKVGETIEVFERPFRVVGVYEPESLGRVKLPLATMQEILNRSGLCSLILVKVDDPARQDEVAARIKEIFPKHSLDFTRDIPILYARGTPQLQTFLKVVIALSIIAAMRLHGRARTIRG